SRFPIPDSRFPIPNSRFPIPDSRFPIPHKKAKKNGEEKVNKNLPLKEKLKTRRRKNYNIQKNSDHI
ncbi:MAG: hypothetical protein F6K26_36850, partial [Moorea sp. SIO2I5]|nr:hypothetical protein [Moorena sp. SIO2I5]